MKSISSIVIILVSVFLLSGCGDKRIDSSDDESLKESISDVRQSLPDEKVKQFDEALRLVMFQDLDFKNMVMGSNVGSALELSKAKNHLDGKTADEIISEAKIVKQKREAEKELRNQKRKTTLNSQIKELEQKKEYAQQIENEINKIKVIYTNFEAKKIGSFKFTDVYCSLQNNSKYTISSVKFKAELKSDDRKVPWYTDYVGTNISGGLNPNENKDLKMHTSSYWDRTKYPNNIYLSITIEALYDENKKRIDSTRIFREFDQEQLDRLKNEYNSL